MTRSSERSSGDPSSRDKIRTLRSETEADLVWLRIDSVDNGMMAIVDVNATRIDDMNNAFKENGGKYRNWTINETEVNEAVIWRWLYHHLA